MYWYFDLEVKMATARTILGAGAALLCATAFGMDSANAQFGNGSGAISGGGTALSSGAGGTVAGRPDGVSSASAPLSSAKSRLPLTTPAVMPYLETTGALSSTQVPGSSTDSKVGKQAYGSSSQRWPYATARVAVTGAAYNSVGTARVPVASRPYRYTGKLYMRFGSSWFVCTASMIKKGIALTAAHCVHNYGQRGNGWADEVRFYPANFVAGGGPWGYYWARSWRIPGPYWAGTDTCQSGAIGIVCNNDIATVVLAPKNGMYPGHTLGGWNGYGWNGFSYVASPAMGNYTVAAITQFGYPVAFDGGYQMQRNDSFGKYIAMTGANGKQLRNTQLGSAMTGGSSGGPWLVNFGTRPSVSSAASLGNYSNSNIIVGVTSWGYTAVGVNVQGASWFGQNAEFPGANYGGRGAGNIGKLVYDTCIAFAAHC